MDTNEDWDYDNASIPNDYGETLEDYVARIDKYLTMGVYEWILVLFYILVFFVGTIGNILVICAVFCNSRMRSVTNVFLLNLAVADFLVLLLCMPPTLVEDIRQTWYFGPDMCKLAKYMQHISVTVSVLTLVTISFERWQAICRPLQLLKTQQRSNCIILAIWIVAVLFCLPQIFSMHVHRFPKLPRTYYLLSECKSRWQAEILLPLKFVEMGILFLIPLIWIGLAYIHIAKVLWFHQKDQRRPHSVIHANQAITSVKLVSVSSVRHVEEIVAISIENNSIKQLHQPRVDVNLTDPARPKKYHVETGKLNNEDFSCFIRSHVSEQQLLKRRRAALMLLVVVIIFFVCYLPVHLLEILSCKNKICLLSPKWNETSHEEY